MPYTATLTNNAGKGAVAILRRVIRRLRNAFPNVIVRVRLDGGFAAPELFDFLDEQRVEYAVGMAKNAVLEGFAELLMSKRSVHSVIFKRVIPPYRRLLNLAEGIKHERSEGRRDAQESR